MYKKIILVIVWILCTLLITHYCMYAINYSNTLLNIVGVIGLALYFVISVDSWAFTRIPFKESIKNENSVNSENKSEIGTPRCSECNNESCEKCTGCQNPECQNLECFCRK